MGRVHEVTDVQTEHQARWLAGQVDQLELEILKRLDSLTTELAATRRVLTSLLISVLVASVTIPIAMIYAAAAGK